MSQIGTHEAPEGNRPRDSGWRRRSGGDRDGSRNVVANRARKVLEHRRWARNDGFSKFTNVELKTIERGEGWAGCVCWARGATRPLHIWGKPWGGGLEWRKGAITWKWDNMLVDH